MIEITCKRCGKKEQRVTAALNCLHCATISPYKYKRLDIVLTCLECNQKFKANHRQNAFCSALCRDIAKNKEINKHWEERKIKKKYKSTAIDAFNTQVSSNMEIIE